MKLDVVLVLAVAIVNVVDYMIKIGNILIDPDSIVTILKDKDAIQIIYKNGVVKYFASSSIGIPYTQFIDELIELSEKKEDRKLLGLTEVTGPGFIINLDDNRQINSSEVLNVSDYLVHEGDLTYIINELFNAGADAIAINDQRITSKTSILCDGNIIRINGEMVSVPITIKAIGYPERLDYALNRPGGYLEILANAGVQVYVQKSDKVTLPKYEGVYSSDFLPTGDE